MDDINRELYDFMKYYGEVVYTSPYYCSYVFRHKSGRYSQFYIHLM